MTAPIPGPPLTPPSADYPVDDIPVVPEGNPDWIPEENLPPEEE